MSRSEVCVMHGLARQHGLAHDVTDGEDVRHVCAHLDVDIDEASLCDGYARFLGVDLFAVGGAAYGLQDEVVGLRCGGFRLPPRPALLMQRSHTRG